MFSNLNAKPQSIYTVLSGILPTRWKKNGIDKWNKREATDVIDTLGNFVLLESDKNSDAGNSTFSHKK